LQEPAPDRDSLIPSDGFAAELPRRNYMLREAESGAADKNNDLTRRRFLAIGTLGAMQVGRVGSAQRTAPGRKAVIQLVLLGGPSQLDTWDLKPQAPAAIRGPFCPISTNVCGIEICEHFPRMATLADKFSLVRSVHHSDAPIHETGLQLLQTGRLVTSGPACPHVGAVAARTLGRPHDPPVWFGLPTPIGKTGVDISHGQDAGFLGPVHDAVWARVESKTGRFVLHQRQSTSNVKAPYSVVAALDDRSESPRLRARYGRDLFGRSCLAARRLVESGARVVTINMFNTIFHRISWDMHANRDGLPVTFDDYKNVVCPMFDRAFSALVSDLSDRGMLGEVLVLAVGEFGRTPWIHPGAGRGHWPGCWTAVLAGGGVRGGSVVGASDKIGAEPKDRPVALAELVATVYQVLGVDRASALTEDPSHRPIVEAAPIGELF
jgi:hypothetical protein